MVQEKAQVLSNRKIAPDHFQMQLRSSRAARQAQPGQFVHLLCGSPATLLRRPFSLFDVDPKRGAFDLIYKVVGLGTSALAEVRAGDRVDFIGPLGRPFKIHPKLRRAWLIGGGVGIPPLYYLAKRLKPQCRATAFLGARTKGWAICADDFKKAGIPVHVATDDGTAGYRGSIVDLLDEEARSRIFDEEFTGLFICGPTPMMAAAARWAERSGIPAQVSLEERMGCAMGCCMGCVVEVATEPVGSHARFQRVCTEGPVFDAQEILWRSA